MEDQTALAIQESLVPAIPDSVVSHHCSSSSIILCEETAESLHYLKDSGAALVLYLDGSPTIDLDAESVDSGRSGMLLRCRIDTERSEVRIYETDILYLCCAFGRESIKGRMQSDGVKSNLILDRNNCLGAEESAVEGGTVNESLKGFVHARASLQVEIIEV